MAARTLAVFLFTGEPSVTAEEIATRLEASAGSVTGAIKQLLRAGLIERLPPAAAASGDPAYQRLAQMHAFYEFLLGEIPSLLERWHQQSG